MHEIPEEIRVQYPFLHFLVGEVDRLTSRFTIALENYRAAERLYTADQNKWGISIALRGQAQVYLDTIRPLLADQLLKDALSLLDPQESHDDVASLLTLIAENQLNLGFPESAEDYLRQARELSREKDVENDYIRARLLLRTGRMDEGIALLESLESIKEELDVSRPQRFHREASLLLSLFYTFKGDLERAELFAQHGIKIGNHLRSSFVQSVGVMRLGHCLQMSLGANWSGDGYQKAIQYYEEAIQKVDIVRIHVEPLWGICRALGYSGKLEEANQVAGEALAIAENAGDAWIGVLIRISLGASQALAGDYEAANQELTMAESIAMRVRDPFSQCAARLWLAYNSHKAGFKNSMMLYLEKALPVIENNHYEFLLTQPSLLGCNDPSDFIPLLIEAHRSHIHPDFVVRILSDLKVTHPGYHPGYGMKIKTLGGFQVWRGRHLIQAQDWKREKARQMLQLLVAHFGKWVHREQITVVLWPDADSATAANNFKVTLNALNQVLEPDRPKGEAPLFILRQVEQYMLNTEAEIVLDVDRFETLIKDGDIPALQKAISWYKGRYFENEYVQEWLVAEEQYYHQQYLSVMERLIELAMQVNHLEEALNYSQQLIAHDPLWEPAYQRQMQIYQRMGNLQMVRSVYQQCQQVFKKRFGSEASQETKDVFNTLAAGM